MSEKIYKAVKGDTLNKVLCCFLAVLSVAATGINYECFAGLENEPEACGVIYEVLVSLQGWGIGPFLFTVCLACIYYYVRNNFSFQKDIFFFAFFLSLLMVMGLCYRNAVGVVLTFQSTAQIVKTGIVIAGYNAMFYCTVLFLQMWLRKLISGRGEEDEDKFQEHYRFKTGIFIFICWLPYLVAFYPGTTTYDAGTMLEQFFGYEKLTNHHPYFQILFLGIFVKAGHYFGSAAAGMFVYVLLQVCAFIMVLAYMADLLRRLGIRKKIINGLVCIYAFLPIFPIYAIAVGKNINFSVAVLLLSIFMFEIIFDSDKFVHNCRKMALLSVILVLICLFRNEGIALVIGCFPCFIAMAKKYWKAFGSIFTGVLLFALLWLKGILPSVGVENGSIAEALSVPFMQTARCVYSYGSEMTQEEIEAIDKVLEFSTLADRYLPEFSDRVKEKYNENATGEEIRAYLQVYFRQFFDHPITYVDAVLNKSYGYFYPDDKGRTKLYYVSYADVPALNADGFDLKSRFQGFVHVMDKILTVFRDIPLIGYTTSIGFYSWCTFLAMFFIAKYRERKQLFIFVPAVIMMLVCVASPVNAYFRYGLSIVFSVPFFAAVVVYAVMSDSKK